MDYGKIANGVFLTEHAALILVENEAKLSSIIGAQPGTVAYTAGCAQVWMLDTDGTTWVPFDMQ